MWRCIFGVLTLLVVCAVRRSPLPRDIVTWGHALIVAALQNAAPFVLLAYGEQHVDSVLAGILNATTPLLTLVFVLAIVADEQLTAGVLVVLGAWRGIVDGTVIGGLACLGAATCYGAGFAYTRRFFSHRPGGVTALSTAQLCCATAELAVFTAAIGATPTWPGWAAAISLLVLGVLGTGLAYILNLNVIRYAGPTIASTVTYVIPLWSTAVGALLLAEPVGWNTFAGAALVIAGVLVSRIRASHPAKATTTVPQSGPTAVITAVDPPGDSAQPGNRITALNLTHRPSERYELDVRAVVSGPVSVEESRCTDGAQLRRPGGDSGYVIAVPVRGAIRATCQGRETDIGPGRAAVFCPLAEAAMDTDDDSDCATVRIDADALERALAVRLGSAVRRPLTLAPTMEVRQGAGSRWAELVWLVLRSGAPGGVLVNQSFAEPLLQALFDAVLHAVAHPYLEALDAPVRSWAPHAIRHGVDTIEAFPERSFTAAELATDAGTSVRALQESWLRHLDVPLEYTLRQARLGHAHGDLVDHAPGDATVEGIGYRWGYARPVRFATDYALRYGLPPEQTLRGPAYA